MSEQESQMKAFGIVAAELSRLEGLFPSKEAKEALATRDAEIARLRESMGSSNRALVEAAFGIEEYGMHLPSCQSLEYSKPCNCGYKEARQALLAAAHEADQSYAKWKESNPE